jgi:hypothetical protein
MKSVRPKNLVLLFLTITCILVYRRWSADLVAGRSADIVLQETEDHIKSSVRPIPNQHYSWILKKRYQITVRC